MNTAERLRRERAEGERLGEPQMAASLPADVENVLSLQRSAGNAGVSRMFGTTTASPRVARTPAADAADDAVTRALAGTIARRGNRERDPAADTVLERESPDPDEIEAELETEEEEAAPIAAPTDAPAASGSRTLARDPTKTKKKSAKAPVAPKLKSETTLKAPDGTSKVRATVGVGEEISFKSNQVGDWTADGGTANAAAVKKFVWTAPSRAASVTVKQTVGALSSTKTITVIEPSTVTGKKTEDLSIPAGTQGAGMKLQFTYGPRSVNFGNVTIKEVSGPASNITGYFLAKSAASLWHDSGDTFLGIGKDNKDSAIDT